MPTPTPTIVHIRKPGTRFDGARCVLEATLPAARLVRVIAVPDGQPIPEESTRLHVASAEVLEPGAVVGYDTGYLRANKADPREYRRTGHIVSAMEGSLTRVSWDDGLGPQVLPSRQLTRITFGIGGDL